MSLLSRLAGFVAPSLFGFALLGALALSEAVATPFGKTIPDGRGSQIPNTYPEVGGTVVVLEGANGNYYYQFVNPSTQFQGRNFSGNPAAFRGNPFQLGPTQNLNCGPTACADYFGGSIQRAFIRLTARDGDACPGNFDDGNDLQFRLNGFTVGTFSNVLTERTNRAGTVSNGFENCFRNQGSNETSTGWFETTNGALLNNILAVGSTTPQVFDVDPNDNVWFFRDGQDATGTPEVAPGITIEKTADKTSYSTLNETINYTFRVRNVGSVQINNIVVTDQFVTGNLTCPRTTLLSAEEMFCTASHQVTQANMDDDIVFVNQATATGSPTEGTLGAVSGQLTIPGPPANNSLTITKTPSTVGPVAVNDPITYTYVVQNTGNITLDGVTVSDAHNGSGALSAVTPSSVTLAPQASQTFQATYSATQADIDAQTPITNVATATATPKRGNIADQTANASVSVEPRTRGLTLNKATSSTDFDAVDDVLTYSFEITNTGNTTITTSLTVNDDKIGAIACPVPAGGLAPNTSTICPATYLVTQNDLNAGFVTNTATVTDGNVTSASSQATVTGTQTSSLFLDKKLDPASPASFADDQIALSYIYDVTNTGNVSITVPIAVTDDKTSVTCVQKPSNILLPGETVSCTSTYMTLQGDVDDGGVTNVATASAGAVTSNSDTVTVPATQMPALTTAKALRSITPQFQTSAQVIYDYTVTNTGNTTVTTAITVDDNLVAVVCPALPVAGLAPGQSITCDNSAAPYSVTAADVQLGSVTNTASATSGTMQSPTTSVTVPTGRSPAISVTKEALQTTFSGTTDTIQYRYTLQNTGNAPFGNTIFVNDNKFPNPIACYVPDGGNPDLTADPNFPATTNGETFTCTPPAALYTITQPDLDAGFVTNEVTASTEFAGQQVVSAPDSVTVNAARAPELAVTKSANPSPFTAANETITYTITVANVGNQTINSITVTDPLIPSLSCSIATIAVGGSDNSCTGTYVTKQADLDAGQIANTATASGVDPQGGGVSDSGGASAADDAPLITPGPNADAKWTLTKTASGTPTKKDDVVDYTFQLENTGNITITSVTLSDSQADCSPVRTAGDLAPFDELGVDETWTYTCSHTVSQLEVDAGEVVNNATANGTVARGTLVDAPATATVPIAPVGGISITKSADISGLNSPVREGDVISYAFTVTNTGNVTLSNVVVADTTPGVAVTGSQIVTLAPGTSNSTAYQATHTVQQADINSGSFTNQASVTGNLPNGGGSVTSQSDDPSTPAVDDPTIVILPGVPSIELIKSSALNDGGDGRADVGDTITYTFTVRNTGNTTLENVSVSDPKVAVTGSAITLQPDDVDSTTFEATHTIIQADIDAGSFVNTATASGTPPGKPPVTDVSDSANPADGSGVSDPTTTLLNRAPAIAVEKVGTLNDGGDGVQPGDTITYVFTVTNTGNTTLTNITLTDPDATVTGGPITSLLPGVSDATTFEATRVLTQPDIDTGSFTNSASVSGNPPTGPPVTDTSDDPANGSNADPNGDGNPDDPTVVALPPAPAIEIIKTATLNDGGDGRADKDDTIAYAFTVRNIGNVTLSNITVSDPAITLAPATPITLAPGTEDTTTFTGSYAITQGDVDTGSFTNSATVSATPPAGPPISDVSDNPNPTDAGPDDPTVTTFPPAPALTLTKAADTSALGSPPAVGDLINYTLVVENTGNVTLNSVTIADPKPGVSVVNGAVGTLLPGASATATASYAITQDDIDAGGTDNQATVTGTSPVGPALAPVSSDDPNTPNVPDDPTTAVIPQTNGLTMVKTATNVNFIAVGDQSTFEYVVTNSGNTRITTPITVTDNLISNVSCQSLPNGGLLPGNSITCTGTYTTTQPALDNGSATNVATATSGGVTSPTVSATIPAASAPALSLAKSIVSGSPFANTTNAIQYRFDVTNTGNVTLTGTFEIVDDKIGTFDCFTQNLAPTNSQFCLAPYSPIQADLDAGFVTNQAYAQNGNVTSPPQSQTANATQTQSLAIAKSGPTSNFTTLGETLNYTYVVTNTGNVTLNDRITVADDKIDAAGGSVLCDVMPAGGLAPQGTINCAGTYAVTQNDLDTGSVTNIANASSGGVTTTTPGTVTVNGTAAPALELIKTGVVNDGGDGRIDENDTITYTFTVRNTGNVTVNNISLTDTVLGPVAGTIGTLAPGAVDGATFQGTYSITQTDINAGTRSNSATATGTPAGGGSVTDTSDSSNPADGAGPDDPTVTPLNREAGLSLTKSADASALQSPVVVGDTITYTLVATNTGNVTLTDVAVSDPKPGVTITNPTIGTLLPGASATRTATYSVQQGDINSGTISNTASVTGNPPAGLTPPTATSDDPNTPNVANDPTVVPVPQAPSISMVKTATRVAFTVPGETSDFDYVVTNNGNTTITAPITVSDNLIPNPVCPDLPSGGLLPNGSITCTGRYVATQEALDNGSVTNIATATDGNVTTPIAAATIPATQSPALTITKTANAGQTFANPGDTLNYAYVLTNAGNLTLTGTTTVVDDRIGTIDCFTGNFVPGSTQTCVGTYTVTQVDIDAGLVTNQAFGRNRNVVSPPQSATVTATQTPSLSVEKSGPATDFSVVDQQLDYTFKVTNNGNTTLRERITVADNRIDGAGGSVLCPAIPTAGFAPGDMITCSGSYLVTQSDINNGFVTNDASATSGTTTSSTDSFTVNAATAPQLELIKTSRLNLGPDGVASEGDTVDYTFKVTNVGNVTISNIMVSDSKLGTLSAPAITLDPAKSDAVTFKGTYTLTQPDVDAGFVSNSAQVTGNPPSGPAISDTSDSSNPNDGAGVNDPTLTPLPAVPSLSLSKSADISGFSNPPAVNDEIVYTLTVTNTGNVTLNGVSVSDTKAGVTIDNALIGNLAPGQQGTTTARYRITQDDIDQQFVINSANVEGNPPNGAPPVSATSDDPATPGSPNDPTTATIPQTSTMALTKSITQTRQLFPFVYEVTYEVNVQNTGNTTLRQIEVEDDLGDALTPGTLSQAPVVTQSGFTGNPVVDANYDGIARIGTLAGDAQLAPGSSGTVKIVATVDFKDGLTTRTNQAFGRADLIGLAVASDAPSVTPGNSGDINPTPPPVVDTDGDGAADNLESDVTDRDNDGVPDARDYDPTGYLYCEDTGTILTGGSIAVRGPFGTQTGVGTSNNITIVRDGSNGEFQFHVSAAGNYELLVTYPPSGVPSTTRLSGGTVDLTTYLPTNPAVIGGTRIGSSNQISNFAAASNPFFTTFAIEAGDPNLFANNIPLALCGTPALAATKVQTGTPVALASGATRVTYRLSVSNNGTTRADNVTLTDNLVAAFGAGATQVSRIALVSATGATGIAQNSGYNGVADQNLLTTGGSLDRGGSVVVEFDVDVSVAASGTYTNTAIAGGTSPLDASVQLPSSSASAQTNLTAPAALAGIRVEKISARPVARIGDVMPYTITIQNLDPIARTNVSLVDMIPAGFTYRPGTATIDGTAVEPVQTGRRLVWAGRTLPASGTVVLQVNLGVGAAATADEFTNRAWVEDPFTGNRISTIGTAVVRREIEHVFDCGEIIGKVWDDKNRNGYQNKGEPGLPGVRIATARGILVKSDKHGRFHVACADVPDARIGSNFIMKVDPRTLPSGYRLTTENPRVVRLTRGKVTKLNFGAAIHRVVRIDLGANAFAGATAKPSAALSRGIDQLVRQLEGSEPSVLRLTYHLSTNRRKLARQRLRTVRGEVTKRWKRAGGRYRLDIETRIAGGR